MRNPAGRLRASRLLTTLATLAACALLTSGCRDERASASPAEAPAPTASPDGQADEHDPPAAGERRPDERPLPSFEGSTLDGRRLAISSLIGQRLVVAFFNPDLDEADPVMGALARVAKNRGRYNFEVVGIAVGSQPSSIRKFVGEHEIDFAVIDDSSARIGRQFGLRRPLVLIGVDSEGYVSWGMGAFPIDLPNAADVIEQEIRQHLRLPVDAAGTGAKLVEHARAPAFEAEQLDGDAPFRSADFAGRPMVLVFFLHTCPHCHSALRFLKLRLQDIPEAKRPVLVGVSLQSRVSEVRRSLQQEGLDFFPVLFDEDRKVRDEYGVFAGVPDTMLIDAQGRIVYRVQGWREDRDPALVRMHLARISGTKVPMLLNPKGYTGNDVCGVCHETEHAAWQLTSHAGAYDTLVTHGANRNVECVGCHVVGFDEPGGFSLAEAPTYLEDVGCESCHGRGGPHLSPGFVVEAKYEAVCATCHNETHSLGFEYASFRPKISHVTIAALSAAERKALVAGHGQVRDVLPTDAEVVGSETCKSCHAAEFATWSKSPHAHAVQTLHAKDQKSNRDCLRCHTTAFGRPGGFPRDAAPEAHEDLARVGCESCHGPGSKHVPADAPKLGSIVSLADKCDSCVILQICGACHDEANDPGFQFRVEERIEQQRHGTIEAGTGRPLDASAGAHLVPPAESDAARAFALLDQGE